MGIGGSIESVLHDARFGLRQLRSTPALFAAVVLSLTLGLGASTAIFSLVDAAILRPLPVLEPNRLVIVEWTNDDFPPGATNINGEFNTIAGGRRQGSSVAASLYRRLEREQTGFASLIGIGAYPDPIALTSGAGPAEQTSIQYVSSNFFQGLGVVPVRGRAFRAEEDAVGREPVVVISHRLWTQRFSAADDVFDRHVRINNVPVRVVGVAPPGFFGTRAGQWPDVYAPLAARVSFLPAPPDGGPRAEDDGNWWVRQVGRLRPDISEDAARARLTQLFKAAVPAANGNRMPSLDLVTLPAARGFEALNEREAAALWTLLLLVSVLLMIVCANVANLLLSRSVARHHEAAMRLALGATRGRVFRQQLIEGAVLSIVGGIAGLAVGYALAQSIHLLFQAGRDASNAFDLHIDGRVIAYTGSISMATALIFSLAPAVRAMRADVGDALKGQTRSIVGGRLRLPRALVSLQIALCLAALVAAGLLGRSLSQLKGIDIGFDRAHVAYASVNPLRAGYAPDRYAPYAERVREALARIPGVVSVSAVQTRLLSGAGNASTVHLPGRPQRSTRSFVDPMEVAHLNAVGPGFFTTVGIPLLAGRAIEAGDIRPDADAVVVDRLFAERFFPNEDPVGRRFGLGPDPAGSSRFVIVGVVGNSRFNRMRGELMPTVYSPYRAGGTIHFAIRSSGDPERLSNDVRQAVAAIDPAVPLTEFHAQRRLIDRLLRTERMLGVISAALGVVALTLAAIGLSGLLAYVVARRRSEIGVRMALGASPGSVVRMVLRDSCGLIAVGALIGVPFSYGVAKVLETSLFRLEPFDVPTTIAALAVLAAVALCASWVPAHRASRIDAIAALRQE